MAEPNLAEGSDESSMGKDLSKLLLSLGQGGSWVLTADGMGLERTFRFKTFKKAWVSSVQSCVGSSAVN